jgi:hypothetical protein
MMNLRPLGQDEHNCPVCSKFFATNTKLQEHFLRHSATQRETALSLRGASSALPVTAGSATLLPTLVPAGFVESQRDRAFQFRAIKGDLIHKWKVYVYFDDFSPEIHLLFDARVQAAYVEDATPSLLPPGQPSAHHVAQVFEDAFQVPDCVYSSQFVIWLATSFPNREPPSLDKLRELLPSLSHWYH